MVVPTSGVCVYRGREVSVTCSAYKMHSIMYTDLWCTRYTVNKQESVMPKGERNSSHREIQQVEDGVNKWRESIAFLLWGMHYHLIW